MGVHHQKMMGEHMALSKRNDCRFMCARGAHVMHWKLLQHEIQETVNTYMVIARCRGVGACRGCFPHPSQLGWVLADADAVCNALKEEKNH